MEFDNDTIFDIVLLDLSVLKFLYVGIVECLKNKPTQTKFFILPTELPTDISVRNNRWKGRRIYPSVITGGFQ